MKILITGTQGLAKELGQIYNSNHLVTMVSKSSGYNIHQVAAWGNLFLHYDCVFNCAYDEFGQVSVLEFFYNHWKHDVSKQIITIGSRCVTHRRIENDSGHWPYRLHKQALQLAHDSMLLDAKCDMKIINPGPIDTAMIQHLDCAKYNTVDLAAKIQTIAQDSTIKRVDLWL